MTSYIHILVNITTIKNIMRAWAKYIQFRCCEQVVGPGCLLFDDNTCVKCLVEVLFWLAGMCMCYFTIIIFYFNPYLFDVIGKPAQDQGIVLMVSLLLNLITVMCVGIKMYNELSHCASYMYILLMYILTIILSNIFSLLIFKYLTTQLYVLLTPLIGLMCSSIILGMFILLDNMMKLLKICFKEFLEDKKTFEKNFGEQDVTYL